MNSAEHSFVLLIAADKIANALDNYRQGAKIKNLGIICKVKIKTIFKQNDTVLHITQGGPGYLYLFANKPVTPVKLFKDHKMMT